MRQLVKYMPTTLSNPLLFFVVFFLEKCENLRAKFFHIFPTKITDMAHCIIYKQTCLQAEQILSTSL